MIFRKKFHCQTYKCSHFCNQIKMHSGTETVWGVYLHPVVLWHSADRGCSAPPILEPLVAAPAAPSVLSRALGTSRSPPHIPVPSVTKLAYAHPKWHIFVHFSLFVGLKIIFNKLLNKKKEAKMYVNMQSTTHPQSQTSLSTCGFVCLPQL